MTPQERQLVDDLFDRLVRLETSPREPDADAAIMQGLRRAPNAVYALVQTVLVQDEALKRASARIQELEGAGEEPRASGGFLDSMRDAILGPGPAGSGQQGRGSVPRVGTGGGAQRGPMWNTGQALDQADARFGGDPRANGDPRQAGAGGGLFGGGNAGGGGGGSFLGTAAATAAGVIGGSMLMNSIKGLMGGGSGSGQQQSLGNTADAGGSKMPWDNSGSDNSGSSGNLARDAGVNDVGKSGGADSQRQGAYDQAHADAGQDHDDEDDYDDFDDDDGDSDFA